MRKITLGSVKASIRNKGSWTGLMLPNKIHPDSIHGKTPKTFKTLEEVDEAVTVGLALMDTREGRYYCFYEGLGRYTAYELRGLYYIYDIREDSIVADGLSYKTEKECLDVIAKGEERKDEKN